MSRLPSPWMVSLPEGVALPAPPRFTRGPGAHAPVWKCPQSKHSVRFEDLSSVGIFVDHDRILGAALVNAHFGCARGAVGGFVEKRALGIRGSVKADGTADVHKRTGQGERV